MKLLIIEDEPSNLRFMEFALRKDFEVIAADSARKALERCESVPGQIGLIVADVIMPGENGAVAARRLLDSNPGASVLFISGYPEDGLIQRNLLNPEDFRGTRIAFLQKPFTVGRLRQRIQEVLARPARTAQ